jgi:hypothetical protein
MRNAGLEAGVTITEKVQEFVFPAASATVQLTVFVPIGNEAPDGGEQLGAPTPVQLSLTDGAA